MDDSLAIVCVPCDVCCNVVLAVSPDIIVIIYAIGDNKLVIISVPCAKYLNILNPKNASNIIIKIQKNIPFLLSVFGSLYVDSIFVILPIGVFEKVLIASLKLFPL